MGDGSVRTRLSKDRPLPAAPGRITAVATRGSVGEGEGAARTAPPLTGLLTLEGRAGTEGIGKARATVGGDPPLSSFGYWWWGHLGDGQVPWQGNARATLATYALEQLLGVVQSRNWSAMPSGHLRNLGRGDAVLRVLNELRPRRVLHLWVHKKRAFRLFRDTKQLRRALRPEPHLHRSLLLEAVHELAPQRGLA